MPLEVLSIVILMKLIFPPKSIHQKPLLPHHITLSLFRYHPLRAGLMFIWRGYILASNWLLRQSRIIFRCYSVALRTSSTADQIRTRDTIKSIANTCEWNWHARIQLISPLLFGFLFSLSWNMFLCGHYKSV